LLDLIKISISRLASSVLHPLLHV